MNIFDKIMGKIKRSEAQKYAKQQKEHPQIYHIQKRAEAKQKEKEKQPEDKKPKPEPNRIQK